MCVIKSNFEMSIRCPSTFRVAGGRKSLWLITQLGAIWGRDGDGTERDTSILYPVC